MIKVPVNPQTSLKRRIKQFYDLLNRGDFSRCHRMLDPRLRRNPHAVTLLQYENSLREFVGRAGPIRVVDIDVVAHLNKPSVLYEGRDFAVGETRWLDESGTQREFKERWVRDGRVWYTRSTGLLFPSPAAA